MACILPAPVGRSSLVTGPAEGLLLLHGGFPPTPPLAPSPSDRLAHGRCVPGPAGPRLQLCAGPCARAGGGVALAAEGVKLAPGWSQLALYWLLPDTGTRPCHSSREVAGGEGRNGEHQTGSRGSEEAPGSGKEVTAPPKKRRGRSGTVSVPQWTRTRHVPVAGTRASLSLSWCVFKWESDTE